MYTAAYTKTTNDKKTWLPWDKDFGQTMWAGKYKANYMSAMMIPDYEYIIKKNRNIVVDLKKKYKSTLGSSKDFDGWNFGF